MMWLAVLSCLLVPALGDMYQDSGNPYEYGSLPVADRIINPNLNPLNPAPMHNRVFYPNVTDSNTYGVFYFVPGFFGFIPPIWYEELTANVAAHGYVVISTWPISNGDLGFRNFSGQAHLNNIDFLRDNLPRNIRDLANFDSIGMGCHSAGCAPTLEMATMDTEQFKATVYLEPVTFAIRDGADFILPSLSLGAELSNKSCSTPNFDFERFYDESYCPKILMESLGFGHCDLLSASARETCVGGDTCDGGDESDLPRYRLFVQGLTAAFLNAHVQGNMEMLDFVSNPDNIPMELKQHRTDLDC